MQWGVHHQQHCMLKILNQQHVRKTQHSHRHRPALAPSWQPLLATTCQAADCKGLLTQRSSRVLAPAAAGNSSSSSSSTSTEASNSLAHQPPQQVTCRRCLQRFSVTENSPTACYYHPAMYTGGEVAKAVGFVRQSDAPEHQLAAVMGTTGLMRFWDCCGASDSEAPGCESGYHISFDDDLNALHGWTE